jgi:trk system potassium uptake protein TrkH
VREKLKNLFHNFQLKMTNTRIIALGFALVILTGALLLCLPFSSAEFKWTNPIDSLFTATTATCVTGLVTLPTASTWSLFGQIVILILIQIGGLGVITIMSGIMLLINKKMGILPSCHIDRKGDISLCPV